MEQKIPGLGFGPSRELSEDRFKNELFFFFLSVVANIVIDQELGTIT